MADRRTKPQVKDPVDEGLGIIRAGESYPLSIFGRLVGLGKAAIRQARRDGLKIRQQGNRSFVLAEDWHDHLRNTEPQPANGGGRSVSSTIHDNLPLGFDLVVSYPLGEAWPVYTAFGVTGAISNRKRFAEGEAGALDHWRDFAAALHAIGAMPAAYYEWAAETEKLLEPATPPKPLPDRVRERVLATLTEDTEFADAVRAIVGGGA